MLDYELLLSLTDLFSLTYLLAAFRLQVCAVYVPFLQDALHTVPLGWQDWGLIIIVAVPIFVLTEVYKWLHWKRRRRAFTEDVH